MRSAFLAGAVSGVAMFDGGRVAAKSIIQETCYPTDCSDADARHIVDAAIREILLQKSNDLPTIDQRLQFRRRAQVFEKVTTIAHVLQTVHRSEKGIFIAFSLAGSVVSIGFHAFVLIYQCTSILTH